MKHRFDERKALEVAIYAIRKVGEYGGLLTVLYLANKLHLKRHGRAIVSDTYENGIGGLAMVAMLSDVSDIDKEDPPIVRSKKSLWDSQLLVRREPDMMFFSRSDIEALDDAIELSEVISDQSLRDLGQSESDSLHDAVHHVHPEYPIRSGAAFIAHNVTETDVVRTMRVVPEYLIDYLNGCD